MTDETTKTTGRFGRGNPGKPKGAVNKATKELKEMILAALDGAGGIQYLQAQADKNPTAFLTLIGKVLPTTLAGSVTLGVKQLPSSVDEFV